MSYNWAFIFTTKILNTHTHVESDNKISPILFL